MLAGERPKNLGSKTGLMTTENTFECNVFINCPFDNAYKPLLRALIFSVMECGLNPRIASESSDSGEVRVNKIRQLIRESCYSIHDISRIEPQTKKSPPRFNLPFELGIDFGCKEYGRGRLRDKKCLILEKKQHRYRTVISDISGNDIKAHGNNAQKILTCTRNWIYENINNTVISATRMWQRYNEFYTNFELLLEEDGYDRKDIRDMPVAEYIVFVREWEISYHATT